MARSSLYSLIAGNKWKTFGFVFLFSIIVILIGLAIGWWFEWGIGAWAIFGIALIGYNLIFYFASKKIALFANGARRADPEQYKKLYNVVEEMSIASGQPMPEVYIVDDPSPNAFATGRNPKNAAVAVTTGLYEMLDRAELQGVIAHEMSHIKNYDILLMTVIAIMVGFIVLARDVFWRWGFVFGGRGRRSSGGRGGGYAMLILLAVGIVLAIVAPLLVALIRAAISRQREYLADASGAMMTRNPEGLASALEKIGGVYQKVQRSSSATAHLFIASPACKDRLNPAKPQRQIKAGAFDTHPPIPLRVERLRQLTLDGEYAQQFAWAAAQPQTSAAQPFGDFSLNLKNSQSDFSGTPSLSSSAIQSTAPVPAAHPSPTPSTSAGISPSTPAEPAQPQSPNRGSEPPSAPASNQPPTAPSQNEPPSPQPQTNTSHSSADPTSSSSSSKKEGDWLDDYLKKG